MKRRTYGNTLPRRKTQAKRKPIIKKVYNSNGHVVKSPKSPMGPPRLPFCRYCSRQYGSASIAIHEKACAKKYGKPYVPRTSLKKRKSTGRIRKDDMNSYMNLLHKRESYLRQNNQAYAPMMDEYDDSINLSILKPCTFCQRKFMPDRVGVHEKVCLQNHRRHRQRQTFQSKKQRLKGSDASMFIRHRGSRRPLRYRQKPKKKSTWRQQHRALIQAAREGRKYAQSLALSKSMTSNSSPFLPSRQCYSFDNHPGMSRSGLIPSSLRSSYSRSPRVRSTMSNTSSFPGLSPTFKTRRHGRRTTRKL